MYSVAIVDDEKVFSDQLTGMGLLGVYLIYSIIKMIQYGRMNDQQFADSRLRTAKARRIKNIVLAAVLVALAAYLIITYLPVLQKAFMI